MKRIALTDGSGRWFNEESAEIIKEKTTHDGRNHISLATGSQWEHECLYRTKSGKWILNCWTNYQGTLETYRLIDNDEAAAWLAKQGIESHPDCEQEYNDLCID